MKTVLIIEDDESLRRGVAFSLAHGNFSVLQAGTLAEGERLARQNTLDLIILDLNLPDGDGMAFCEYIRRKSGVPIIMLTARDMATDEIAGLRSGADDYITKPFNLSVLHARMESLMRRAEKPDAHTVGEFALDTSRCKFFRGESEIPISATEFKLLRLMMENAGQILSKEQILAALWDNGDYVDENIVPVNINRLRGKVEANPKAPRIIKTVYGMGYIWVREGRR